MALTRDLNKDIESLILGERRVAVNLPGRPGRRPLSATRGLGKPPDQVFSGEAIFRSELLSVFSILVITEDGAFEKPLGWPDSGAYPAEIPPPAVLPNSLLFDGLNVSLDTSVAYYEQQRVHYTLYETSSGVHVDTFLIPYAYPLNELKSPLKHYARGLKSYSDIWTPSLRYHAAFSGNAYLQQIMKTLSSSGILNAYATE